MKTTEKLIQPVKAMLTQEILSQIDGGNFVYGELAEPGVMGNDGGVMLYVLKNDIIIATQHPFLMTNPLTMQ